MNGQASKALEFFELHKQGEPLVLVNIWDAGSASVVAASGARAIATGSAPVASSCGFEDGEKIPFMDALSNLKRILDAVDMPVSMDIEGGYGSHPSDVAETFVRVVQAGAVGVNLEDRVIGAMRLFSVAEQSERIRAARHSANQEGVRAFINARTDLFLQAPVESHDTKLLRDAVERCKAYEAAGANGFFVPGLIDESLIGELCAQVDLPVNVLASATARPLRELANLGVARISHGPYVYKVLMEQLGQEAARLHGLM